MEEQRTMDSPTKLCKNCREKINAKAETCPKCGTRQELVVQSSVNPERKKCAKISR